MSELSLRAAYGAYRRLRTFAKASWMWRAASLVRMLPPQMVVRPAARFSLCLLASRWPANSQ